ncbi:MAG: hypothetical protein HOK91_16560 [Gammaproteobacteria bacterium]|nr:hypothetical protein [Gammaproteobacteria bacterium]
MNWISAALLTTFVVLPGIFAQNHIRSGMTIQQMVTTFELTQRPTRT